MLKRIQSWTSRTSLLDKSQQLRSNSSCCRIQSAHNTMLCSQTRTSMTWWTRIWIPTIWCNDWVLWQSNMRVCSTDWYSCIVQQSQWRTNSSFPIQHKPKTTNTKLDKPNCSRTKRTFLSLETKCWILHDTTFQQCYQQRRNKTTTAHSESMEYVNLVCDGMIQSDQLLWLPI